MQTALYQVKFRDGRTFNVYCGNNKQNRDILLFIAKNKNTILSHGIVSNGIIDMLHFKKTFNFK